MTHAIQADGLEKRFGETRALAGVSLTAPPGTVLGVLGPNGAGKTTMTRILATLIEPTAGSARVGGYDVVKEAHKVRQLIGLTGQYAGVDEMLTGTENLVLIGRLLGMSRRASKARAAELLDRFQLTDAAERAAPPNPAPTSSTFVDESSSTASAIVATVRRLATPMSSFSCSYVPTWMSSPPQTMA